MIDLKFIRQNPDQVRKAIEVKRIDLDLDQLLAADSIVLEIRKTLQSLEEEKNANAKRVSQAKLEERSSLIENGRKISQQIESCKPRLQTAEDDLKKLLWLVPNIPSPEAPIGANEDENVEIKRWGLPKKFDFTALDHVQILENHQWAELVRISKIAGSRSYSLRNEMVLLEMAFHRFALERLRAKGFNLITVPALAREFAFFGTGHFPTGREQAYFMPADDLYLAGTSEVPLNGLHSGEILKESDLPILYAGFSPFNLSV